MQSEVVESNAILNRTMQEMSAYTAQLCIHSTVGAKVVLIEGRHEMQLAMVCTCAVQ